MKSGQENKEFGTKKNQFLRPDGSVDLEEYMKQYPKDDDIPEDIWRFHIVRMTQAQRNVFLDRFEAQKADKVRQNPEIAKRYNISEELDNKSVLEIAKYDDYIKHCQTCDGESCYHKDCPYYAPKLVWNENKATCDFITSSRCPKRLKLIKIEKIQLAFKGAKIPSKYQNLSFEDYKVTKQNKNAVDQAKKFLNNPVNGIFLYGVCGCGKTMLAAIIANELVKLNQPVLFETVPRLLSDLKASFDSDNSVSFNDLMHHLFEVDFLILDDLGAEKISSWSVETLFEIVNERYNEQRPTIFTSNLDGKSLSDVWNAKIPQAGTRIISRIFEVCEVLKISQADFRKLN